MHSKEQVETLGPLAGDIFNRSEAGVCLTALRLP